MASTEITSTLEAYLEAIYELSEIGERVTQARLARWFGVSPPTTSEVVHRMERLGLIGFADDRSLTFTEKGLRLATEMARRHRMIERYLVDVLGVPWHLADEECRKIEPGISDVVERRMREALGTVDRCPHGNPIPGSDAMQAVELTPLDTCDPGWHMRIDRIREDLELDLDMLRYLEEHELFPGTELEVSDRDPEGTVTVVRAGSVVAVGPALASHVLCVKA